MPTPTDYINDIREIPTTILGSTATKTGEYYSYIYSERDSNTGVPVLGVKLQDIKSNGSGAPIPINNFTDAQVLNLVLAKQTPQEPLPIATTQMNTPNSIEEGYSGFGIFIFIILMVLVGFVYFIVRLWQDHQAQKDALRVMRGNAISSATTAPSHNTSTTFSYAQTLLSSDSITDWRQALEIADNILKKLIDKSEITGESMSDKLKQVSAGQFASIDVAWEAHQSAKLLLASHDSDISIGKVHRVMSLYKQVFAEHGVI